MDTKPLAAGIVGFLLGGLVVSVAASLEDDARAESGAGTEVVSLVVRLDRSTQQPGQVPTP